MKNRFENSYWPNAFGAAAFFLACALAINSCSKVFVEQEKTKQIEFQNQKK